MLSTDNHSLKAKVEGYFLPFRCCAEIRDYEAKLQFRIYDRNNNPLFTMDQISLIRSNDDDLQSILEQVKSRISNI